MLIKRIITFAVFAIEIQTILARTISQSFGKNICRLVNEYRQENGKSVLEMSYTMETLAQVHLDNLIINNHQITNQMCNLHSWYPMEIFKTTVSRCCYPSDQCMRLKGRELTTMWKIPYQGIIAENAFASGGFPATPDRVVDSWKASPSHNAIMLSDTGKICGAVLNSTYQISIGLMWIGTELDRISYLYDGPPELQQSETRSSEMIQTSTQFEAQTTKTSRIPIPSSSSSTTKIQSPVPPLVSSKSTQLSSPTSSIHLSESLTSGIITKSKSTTASNMTNMTNIPRVNETILTTHNVTIIRESFVFTEAMFITAVVGCFFVSIVWTIANCFFKYKEIDQTRDINTDIPVAMTNPRGLEFEPQYMNIYDPDEDSRIFTREYFRRVRKAEDKAKKHHRNKRHSRRPNRDLSVSQSERITRGEITGNPQIQNDFFARDSIRVNSIHQKFLEINSVIKSADKSVDKSEDKSENYPIRVKPVPIPGYLKHSDQVFRNSGNYDSGATSSGSTVPATITFSETMKNIPLKPLRMDSRHTGTVSVDEESHEIALRSTKS